MSQLPVELFLEDVALLLLLWTVTSFVHLKYTLDLLLKVDSSFVPVINFIKDPFEVYWESSALFDNFLEVPQSDLLVHDFFSPLDPLKSNCLVLSKLLDLDCFQYEALGKIL